MAPPRKALTSGECEQVRVRWCLFTVDDIAGRLKCGRQVVIDAALGMGLDRRGLKLSSHLPLLERRRQDDARYQLLLKRCQKCSRLFEGEACPNGCLDWNRTARAPAAAAKRAS